MKVLSCSGGTGANCVTLAKSLPHSRASLSPYVQRRGRAPAAIHALPACPFPSPPEQFLYGGRWGVMCVLGPATPAPNQDEAWWSGLNCLSPSFLLPPCLLPFVFFLKGPRVRVPRRSPCVTTPSTGSHSSSPYFAPVVTGGPSWDVEVLWVPGLPSRPWPRPKLSLTPLPKAGACLAAVGTRTD